MDLKDVEMRVTQRVIEANPTIFPTLQPAVPASTHGPLLNESACHEQGVAVRDVDALAMALDTFSSRDGDVGVPDTRGGDVMELVNEMLDIRDNLPRVLSPLPQELVSRANTAPAGLDQDWELVDPAACLEDDPHPGNPSIVSTMDQFHEYTKFDITKVMENPKVLADELNKFGVMCQMYKKLDKDALASYMTDSRSSNRSTVVVIGQVKNRKNLCNDLGVMVFHQTPMLREKRKITVYVCTQPDETMRSIWRDIFPGSNFATVTVSGDVWALAMIGVWLANGCSRDGLNDDQLRDECKRLLQ